MSSNSRAVHYTTAAALYGQQQRRAARERAAEEEEEVAPEDSASAQVSPTNKVTNSLDTLALIRDELEASEDIVMGEDIPQGFEEALQSFRAVDDELKAVLSGDPGAQFDLSRQLGRRTAGPPASQAEMELEEVFMEHGIADTSATTECEAGEEPLPLEDDNSSAMSSLSSQLSDVAPHPGYPFWKYRRTTHGAPIVLPDMLPQRGVPQQADYVALNIERHDGEPTIYSTMGGGAPIYCNVLHAEPRPEIPPGDGGDDLYLLGERFQMDYVVTRAIEAVGDAGVVADIYRLRRFSERKREIQRERQRLSRLADFLTSEWQRHYGEERQLRAQEEAAIKRLIAAQVMERMEPYIHFNDEHTYLSRSYMRNDILRSGWNELKQNYGTDIARPRPTVYGSWTTPERYKTPEPGSEGEVLTTSTTPQTSPSAAGSDRSAELRAQAARRRSSRCKYCTVRGHFAKECTVSHRLCHRVGGGRCSFPRNHFHYRPIERPTCPYVGFHSNALYKQVEQSGIEDGEMVNTEANK